MIVSYSISKRNAETKLQRAIETSLEQAVNELKIRLEKHSYLPSLLSNDSEIISFLNTKKSDSDYISKQENINLSLELANNISGTTNLYLLDSKGKALSSSNWAEKESFIGSNFSIWPYFEQASYNALGRYFSSDATTRERFYFFSRSVQYQNKLIGVIVAQVPLSGIAFEWTVADVDFFITDQNGVVFLSNKASLDMKAITKLDVNFNDSYMRYHNQKLTSLNNQKIDLEQQGFQIINLVNQKHLMLSEKMALAGWTVRTISKYSIAQKEISRNMTISIVLILLTSLLALLLLNLQRQRNKFRQQAKEVLEHKVKERTQALKKSQQDLIQAAKMAALGQLSTGITHEINNPLMAIRSYADNAEQFLKKDQLKMVQFNLKEISKLTENMAAITGQLKSFARKSKGELHTIDIDQSINYAISIVNPELLSSGTNIHYTKHVGDDPQYVLADKIWLSQILINLITNAISATKDNPIRDVWINTKQQKLHANTHYCIEIRDNGTGIDDTNLSKIFEPFFTTKPMTKGLGLGLSISYTLAKDMNGTLDARNHKDGGALFTLCLPSTNK